MNTNIKEDPIRIFVSYAHKADRRWFDEEGKHNLIPWLIESLRKHNVVFWYDQGLLPSEVFTRRIQEEIDQAHIAILMVSQPFLNSPYIEEHELPRIKESAQRGKLSVLPVLIEPCAWDEDDFLSARQMLPGKPTPLINYIGHEAEWAQVKFELLDGIKKLIKKIRAEQRREDVRGAVEVESTRNRGKQEESAKPEPTIKFLAVVDGREVSGAKVSDGESTWDTPIALSLETGAHYIFKFTYRDSAGMEYGRQMEVTPNWIGEQVSRVSLISERETARRLAVLEEEERKLEAEILTFEAKTSAASRRTNSIVGPNEPCPCGSNRKYKRCHGRG